MASRQAGKQIMLVDDDQTIVETVAYNLARHGFKSSAFTSGRQALKELDEVCPDLVILDWMLPDLAGPEICKLIRSRQFAVPILMLTGRATPLDVAEALNAGADDYLSKPFSIIELMARIQALLRRAQGKTGSKVIQVGGLMLDEEARRICLNDKEVDLSPKEFQLLKVLMQSAGKTFSTEVLLNQVWGVDFAGDLKTVAVHIRWLRQKLEEDPKNPRLIKTVHRSGYRLEPEAAGAHGSGITDKQL